MSSTDLAVPEVRAAAGWRQADFISDLHLSSDTPLTFAAWRDYMRRTTADAVLILGDLFEVWVGDDARFEGFDAEAAAVLHEATRRGRFVAFMVGNRDFLVGDTMLRDVGVAALADPTLLIAFGQRLLLTHGDALCLDDTEYQQFRAIVRQVGWQQKFLSQPLPARREYARQVREQSEARKKASTSPMEWADVDFPAARVWLDRAATGTLVHGHTHRPATEAMDAQHTRHVLSDWDLDHPPHRAEVLRLDASGLHRLTLAEATAG
jgi:UDP-2,3-diacylglucosamine hydrolase